MKTGNKSFAVSVILTLYNSRKYYRRALNSILNQTFNNIEIIIVDDGSNDKTEVDLIPEIKSFSNIKYLRHSNRKHAISLNSGILVSSGEFITFLDADDEYRSDHIMKRVNYFKENSKTDLINTGAEIIGNEEDMYIPDVNDLTKLIHIKDCVMLGTLFGKRKVFIELDGFKDVYSHDSDFLRRAEKVYNTNYFDSDTYVYYRNNPDSVLTKLKQDLSTRK